MITVGIREFVHNYRSYLKKVRSGKEIVLTERNVPIANISRHNENVLKPGWKRDIPLIKLKNGVSMSASVQEMRDEERA